MVETITIHGIDFEYLVGFDVLPERARELIDAGRATAGRELEAPPALYLQQPIRIRGRLYPAGHMLHVGLEISEAEALCLMRGAIGTHARICGVEQPATPAVAPPGGGIG